MPEGNGEQGQGGVGDLTPEQFMAEFGFKTLAEAKTALGTYKTDVPKLKAEARTAKELADKLAAYEAAEAKRKESEMTETQKLAEKLAGMEKQMAERDALIAAKDQAILVERVFSSKLNGKTPEESAVLRRLLSSAVAGQTFADEAELAELLKPVEMEYATLRAAIAAPTGNRPGIGSTGAPPQLPTGSPAGQDFQKLSLADQIKLGQRLTKG